MTTLGPKQMARAMAKAIGGDEGDYTNDVLMVAYRAMARWGQVPTTLSDLQTTLITALKKAHQRRTI
jgi:hypothetical protein